MAKVKNIGKFRYIEPNDVLENDLYDNKFRSFNTVHPYEDYSISVELEVGIPNRGVWVADVTKRYNIGVENNTSKTISFFEGKEGYLTNNPGSLTYKDLLNGDNDNESLGITHIHIGYNSYFYPEVTIQFTDIRGMGLMMPHEDVYRSEQQKQKAKTEKFFAALFTFPYPEFKLRVKGFYGKKVEYSLVVSDFRSSFNNQTGNFEATVKFIGKMYGVYTDIPMAYLMIAPYCTYGTDGRRVWDVLDFKIDNTPMPTFYELEEKILKSTNEIEASLNERISQDLQSAYQQIRMLNVVQNSYNNVMMHLDNNASSYIIKNENICLLKHEEQDGGKFAPYSYLYQSDNCKLRELTSKLHDDITKCNKDCGTNLPYLTPLSKRNQDIGDGNYLLIVKKDSHGSLNFEWSNDSIKFELDEYPNLKERISQYIKKTDSEEKFFVLNGIELNKNISTLQEGLNDKIEELGEKFNKNLNKTVEDLLGFKPSIKNIFKITLGHLQAFITLLANCVSNINNDTNRTIKNKGLSLKNLPDVPQRMNDSAHLPPFPAIKRVSDNVFCYPKEPIIRGTMAETELIDSLFIGCSNANKKKQEIENLEKTKNIDRYFIPTCISDFYTQLVNSNGLNPYQYAFNTDAGNVKIDWIMTFFGFRCIQKFMMESSFSTSDSSDDLTPEEFGIYEAYNFWLANPTLNYDIIQKLTTGDGNSVNNFINFLKGESVYGVPPCYRSGDKFYNKWLNESESELELLKTDRNMPASIGYGGSFNLFNTEIDKVGFSYINGIKREYIEIVNGTGLDFGATFYIEPGSRPFELMKEIPANALEVWHNSISNRQDIPNNLIKHQKIIGKYLDIAKNTNNELYYPYTDKIKKMYYNPAWNVIYQKETFGKFYQEMANHITSFNTDDSQKLVSINYLSNINEHSSLSLHTIQTMDQIPMFFYNMESTIDDVSADSSAEMFLSSIPHNIYRIAKELSEGKKIINIPFTTKLFLGYVMDGILNCEDEYEMLSFLEKVTSRAGSGKTWKHDPYYIIDGSYDGVTAKYGYLIEVIMHYLFTNENGQFAETPKWITVDDIRRPYDSNLFNLSHVCKNLNFFKTNGYFYKDISGFIEEYKEWKVSYNREFSYNGQPRGVCGWQWLRIKMCLKEKIDDNGVFKMSLPLFDNGNYIRSLNLTPKGDTQIDRLKSILKASEIKDRLQNLNNLSPDLSICSKNPNNPLLYYYVHYNEDNNIDMNNEYNRNDAFSNIYNAIYYNTDNDSVILKFNPNYDGVKELDKIFKTVSYFIAPYNMTSDILKNDSSYSNNRENNKTLKTSTSNFRDAHTAFINAIKILYKNDQVTNSPTTENNVNYNISEDSKLAMYRTLKNLYDKHFTNIVLEKEYFDINSEDLNAEINKFHFIDTYYQDLSDKLFFNSSTVLNLLKVIRDGYNSGAGDGLLLSEMSLYSFMSLLCQKHNMMMLAMPVFNGVFTENPGTDNFKKMFTPISYNDSQKGGNTLFGPSYVCFYPHQASQHLDISTSQYENDGFLITDDLNSTSTFEGPNTINDLLNDSKYVIPAFAVEYGSQKQSIFKSINVNMDNPQVTEASVANQFYLAKNNNTDIRRLGFEGQDLFKIFSNYSYTCQVEMMGCAQIQPLMYFQLNNIPMFRGAYQIIQVEHDITPGNMSTRFKGVRINKTNIPMTSCVMNIDIKDFLNNSTTLFGDAILGPYVFKTLTQGETHIAEMINFEKSIIGYQNLNKDYITIPDEKMQEFNMMNPCLRKLMYCLTEDMPKLSEKLGYKIGIYVTSIKRYAKDSTSDHCFKSEEYGKDQPDPKPIRSHVKGYQIDNNCDVINEEQTYDNMCCAIDFCGTKNGEVDKNDASVQLYNHIACNYNKYVNQLIWEMKTGTPLTSNNISNIIHLSSIGEASETNKCQLFAATVDQDFKTKTIKDINHLPNAFKQVCTSTKTSDNTHIEYLSGNA